MIIVEYLESRAVCYWSCILPDHRCNISRYSPNVKGKLVSQAWLWICLQLQDPSNSFLKEQHC